MSRQLSVDDGLHLAKVEATPVALIERRISELESVDLATMSIAPLVEMLRPLLEIYVSQPLDLSALVRSSAHKGTNDSCYLMM